MFDLANWGRGKRLAVPARGRNAVFERIAQQEEAKRKECRKAGIKPKKEPFHGGYSHFGPSYGWVPTMFKKPVKNEKKLAKDEGPKSAFDSKYTFIQALERKGFKKLGSGYYSVVLHKKGERVIKVGKADQWINYVLWAGKTGYGGTFAPKVYSYKMFPGKKKGNDPWGHEGPFYVAVMEKLEKTVSSARSSEDMVIGPYLFQTYLHKNAAAGRMLDVLAPGLRVFSDQFKKTFKNGWDLHNGNFMLRSDGGLVLTDPIARADVKIKDTRLRTKDFSPPQAANDNEVRLVA